MKLLLDQNVSFRIVESLQNLIPELTHVKFEKLANVEDKKIWDFAKKTGYTIVTFDSDFYELQTIKGFPPKIIWLRFGNTTRKELVDFFTKNVSTIKRFLNSEDFNSVGCLEFS